MRRFVLDIASVIVLYTGVLMKEIESVLLVIVALLTLLIQAVRFYNLLKSNKKQKK